MIHFETAHFKKIQFTPKQVEGYLENAKRDLKIATEDKFLEVRFTYAYQALIKTGIALLAGKGQVKVRSVPGHHVKILQKMGEILKNKDIQIMGNAMRMKRNLDMYEGGMLISEKEVDTFLKFVEQTLKAVKDRIQ